MTDVNVVLQRQSIRAYEETPVADKDVEQIITAGRWAPNAGPFDITVVRNADLRREINDATLEAMKNSGNAFLQSRAELPGYQPLYGAPLLILLSAPESLPYSAHNTSLAAENMLLTATALGLGSCFLVSPTLELNGANKAQWAPKIALQEGYKVQCALVIGTAAKDNPFALAPRTEKGTVRYID